MVNDQGSYVGGSTTFKDRVEVRTTSDPMQRVWTALEDRDCRPRGALHQFRALCPAHDSDASSLAVGEGADGRALLHCKVGCEPHAIVGALGLRWADLFPGGHRHAERKPGVAPPKPPIYRLLTAILRVGSDYRCHPTDHRFWTARPCWVCGGDRVWIHEDERRRVSVCCFNGCEQHVMFDRLER